MPKQGDGISDGCGKRVVASEFSSGPCLFRRRRWGPVIRQWARSWDLTRGPRFITLSIKGNTNAHFAALGERVRFVGVMFCNRNVIPSGPFAAQRPARDGGRWQVIKSCRACLHGRCHVELCSLSVCLLVYASFTAKSKPPKWRRDEFTRPCADATLEGKFPFGTVQKVKALKMKLLGTLNFTHEVTFCHCYWLCGGGSNYCLKYFALGCACVRILTTTAYSFRGDMSSGEEGYLKGG